MEESVVEVSSAARTAGSRTGDMAAAFCAATVALTEPCGSGVPSAETTWVLVVTGGLFRSASSTWGLPSARARPQFSQVCPP